MYSALSELNLQLPEGKKVEQSLSTVLFGAGGTLDSLALAKVARAHGINANQVFGRRLYLAGRLGECRCCVVQLTISASTSTAIARPGRQANYALLGFLLLSLIAGRRKRSAPLNFTVIAFVLSACISCGGGGTAGTGTGGGTPGNQIIDVPVIVQDLSFTNTNNKKILGPIVITLQ
jgi:hypothetical protein